MPWHIFISVIAALLLCVGAAAALAARRAKRHQLAASLQERDDDQVHYAFIANPSKPMHAERMAQIQRFCAAKQLKQVQFIETTLQHDGRWCALKALREGADVVIAVGGDGTVRTVASAVSGTPHAMGIVPVGTANLFARNMGIPLNDVDAALQVATSHGSLRVDMGRVRVLDDATSDHGHAFLIIAGIGFDALMIDDTNPKLKKTLSWMAYFVSGVKHLFAPKHRATIVITGAHGGRTINRNVVFRTMLAGNCGEIPMLSLIPGAIFDDGQLDFEIIDTTAGLIGWANLLGDMVHQTLTGKAQRNPLSTNSRISQIEGVKAEVILDKPALAQVDGDTLGATQHVLFEVEKQALCVRVPERSATSMLGMQLLDNAAMSANASADASANAHHPPSVAK